MEPVTDKEIDRELQALLTSEPSSDFVARVRTAIAARERGPSIFQAMPFRVAAAGVVGALILGAFLYNREAAIPSIVASPPSRNVRSDIQLTPDSAQALVPAARVLPVRGRRVPATAPDPSLAVLISPADVEAYHRLLSSVSEQRLVLLFEETNQDRGASNALTIPPILIEPLDPFSEQQGVFQ